MISVLSHLGLTASYPALVGKSRGSEVEGDSLAATGMVEAQANTAEDAGSEEEYWCEDSEEGKDGDGGEEGEEGNGGNGDGTTGTAQVTESEMHSEC